VTPCLSVVIPCFKDEERAIDAAMALRDNLAVGQEMEIIIVDDGSGVARQARLLKDVERVEGAKLLRLSENVGRSAARNAGARMARGEVVMFMDSDCLPVGDPLAVHSAALTGGAVASFGDVQGLGDLGFWDHYQRRSSERRARLYASGASFAGSSQNLAVRRDAFLAIGGFDEQYAKYGFEDRDLLIRIAARGRIAYSPDAVVSHRDALSLLGTARKMREGGHHSSGRFRERHPLAYRALGYQRFDVADGPRLVPLARIARRIVEPVARLFDALERRVKIPLSLGAPVVRLVSALAYLDGTLRRETDARKSCE
jgi:GT2 family glycosyltransferase